MVSRIPLRGDDETVIGTIGIVLFDHPETTLQPLISKYALMLGRCRGDGSRGDPPKADALARAP